MPVERVIGDLARCQQMRDWLAAAVRAFLDAYLREDPSAVDYLAGDDLAAASGGAIEWKAM